MKSTKSTKSKSKPTRVSYNFKLNYPNSTFTIRDLMAQYKSTYKADVGYITIYKRVQAEIAKGNLVTAGKRHDVGDGAGRPESIFAKPEGWAS
jgi:hypothetical protein